MPDETRYFEIGEEIFALPENKDAKSQRAYVDSVCTTKGVGDWKRESIQRSLGIYEPDSLGIFPIFLIVIAIIGLLSALRHDFFSLGGVNPFEDEDEPPPLPVEDMVVSTNAMVLSGRQLRFTDSEIHTVLVKRQPFYNKLDSAGQKKFIKRLNRFMDAKDFVIHDNSGFKEMPILVSAAAIQLTFGLSRYRLLAYNQIHIHPEEYFGAADLRVLAGNVQGRRIALSWKHFLEGFHYPENGENVGLHEMAHALYGQVFWFDKRGHRHFRAAWLRFSEHAVIVFEAEKNTDEGLYSDYGIKSMHEFWAESVELFFEKPIAMQQQYPQLYQALCHLLRQTA